MAQKKQLIMDDDSSSSSSDDDIPINSLPRKPVTGKRKLSPIAPTRTSEIRPKKRRRIAINNNKNNNTNNNNTNNSNTNSLSSSASSASTTTSSSSSHITLRALNKPRPRAKKKTKKTKTPQKQKRTPPPSLAALKKKSPKNISTKKKPITKNTATKKKKKRKKMKDPTSKKIFNGFKRAKSLEEQWLDKYPDETLEYTKERVVNKNFRCHCCLGAVYKFLSIGDLKHHIQANKHVKNLKKWNETKDRKRQSTLNVKNIGVLQTQTLNSYMYSSLNAGFSTLSICKFKKKFIDNYCGMKYGQQIPNSATSYANKAREFKKSTKRWAKEEAAPSIIARKSYSIIIDAASDIKLEVFAPMVAFNAKQKPLLMEVVFTSTNSNGSSVQGIVNKQREDWGLDSDLYRYLISDGTEYNCSAYRRMRDYYTGLHHLISILHIGSNGMNNGLDKCDHPLIILMRECMKKGPMLFSLSHGRRSQFSFFKKRLNKLDEDPLISDLFEKLEFSEVCELYDIPYKDEQSLIHCNIFDEDQVDEIRIVVQELYKCDYLKTCCLNRDPPRRITNKWKTTPLATYYFANNLRIFKEFCFKCIENEDFFVELTDLQIRALKFAFFYSFKKFVKVLMFLLKYEGRVALLHWIFFDCLRLQNLFIKPITVKNVGTELKMLFLDYVKHEDQENGNSDDIDNNVDININNMDDVKKQILKKDCIEPIESLRLSLYASFSFQFRDNKESISLFECLWQFNPFNPEIKSCVLAATIAFRNGPNSLGNQLNKLKKWKIEWAHWTKIVVPFIQSGNSEVTKSIKRVFARKKKYGKTNANKNKNKNENKDEESDCDSDYDSDEESNSKYILTEKDQKRLLTFAKQGFEIDIIGMFKCRYFTAYELLPKFAIDVLDHPHDSTDNERFYSFLAFINNNKLTKSLRPDLKSAKLWSMWHKEIIERKLFTNLHEFQ